MDDNRNDSDDEELETIAIFAGSVFYFTEFDPLFQEHWPFWSSSLTGHKYITDLIKGNPAKTMAILRMQKGVFVDLCNVLTTKYGLVTTRELGAKEIVAIFVYIVAQGVGNRTMQDRFQHSGETIHRHFHSVLESLYRMSKDIIKPRDPEFKDIPKKIYDDQRYWPFFRDCIDAIDGTHIPAVIPQDTRVPYIGRKGVTTQNVMAVCSAHDSHIFHEILGNDNNNFPQPPQGKYYLVDAGYPNQRGYLAPYKGQMYHLEVFQNGPEPQGPCEAFNRAHSSLRSVIERTFGILKKKWLILSRMPSYSFETQVKIVVACMTLHNFVRLHKLEDEDFTTYNDESVNVNATYGYANKVDVGVLEDIEMMTLRDMIAAGLFEI
ncbi:uncharacterized protein LOC120008776 [Tripterygium wilfordii]|uniref:uncharacterized protein LOC120008776 n=1 Tax=Tripterygium wilfordii TaxID=458696 RepID=UPI0018F81113|nr:uncharacterized protein LOC120008776 [Tripterygium wilfordii]